MKRVGIILESIECNRYLYNLILRLSKCDNIELSYLINSDTSFRRNRKNSIIRNEGPFSFLNKAFFSVVCIFESKLLGIVNKDIGKHYQKHTVVDVSPKIYLEPMLSPSDLIIHYEKEDIEKIRRLDLDIIIIGSPSGLFKGDILRCAKDGLLALYHGYNHFNRGEPTAFWEVYRRSSSTGFVIERLTEDLDDSEVLFRGKFTTQRTYTENLINLYSKSYPYLAQILISYANGKGLPSPEPSYPYSGTLLKRPSIIKLLVYTIKTKSLLASKVLRKIILRKDYRWGIAFTKKPWQKAVFRKAVQVKNPPNRYFADPHVITKDGRTICFVEDFFYKHQKGCITAIELFEDNRYEILGHVIEEPFHLSYPYIFEYEGNLYITPETGDQNSVRLYKCVDFPLKWEYQRDIVKGRVFLDPTVFCKNGKWFLLVNTEDLGLIAFHSSNPIEGEWIEHSDNPLLVDSNCSRNGGFLLDTKGNIYRGRQKQGFDLYGASLTIARIDEITEGTYCETKIGSIKPDFFKGLKGTHHIHSNGEYTVFDFARLQNKR